MSLMLCLVRLLTAKQLFNIMPALSHLAFEVFDVIGDSFIQSKKKSKAWSCVNALLFSKTLKDMSSAYRSWIWLTAC